MGRVTTGQLMSSKLIANGIIPRGTPIAFKRHGSSRWSAIHALTKAPLGIWSDHSMISLLSPGELKKDARGRVTRR